MPFRGLTGKVVGGRIRVMDGEMGKEKPRAVIVLKRPEEATPERALLLLQGGLSIIEIAARWGITRGYIYYLLHRAGWKANSDDKKL